MSKSVQGITSAPRNFVKSPVTPDAIARIQSSVAKQNGGGVPKDSYVGRMQKAAAKFSK